MSTPIWFDDSEAGAPVLNNANGSGIALLLACLKNGFNVKAITSITVASGVATVLCPTHAFSGAYGKLVLITGASVPALNGNKQPTVVDANNFTFPAPGVADGTYTATDARRAPLGWTDEFSDGFGTKVIFKRTAPEALAPMLRIDDSVGASLMRVRMVEAATGIDALTGLAPTDAQVNGGGYWQKGDNNATAKKWAVIGNDRAFYLATQLVATGNYVVYLFGDGVPFAAGDSWFTLLSVQTNTGATSSPTFGMSTVKGLTDGLISSDALYASRGRLAGSTTAELSAITGIYQGGLPIGSASTNMQSELIHPTVGISSNVMVLSPNYVRGEVPGFACPMADLSGKTAFVPMMAGADVFLPVRFNRGGTVGCLLIRISGEWY